MNALPSAARLIEANHGGKGGWMELAATRFAAPDSGRLRGGHARGCSRRGRDADRGGGEELLAQSWIVPESYVTRVT
jgi:hypothetical protein